MKYLIVAIMASLVLSGCGTVNPVVSAGLNSAGQDYMGAKANIQQADDMKLRLWLDGACAVNVGALQRAISTSGNPSIANAIFTACPVPAVGVTSTNATGSMQVQTFNLPPIVRDSTGSVSSTPSTSTPVQSAPVTPLATPQAIPVPKSAAKPAAKTVSKPVAAPVQPTVIVPVQPTPQPLPPVSPPSLSLPSALPGQ